MTTVTGRDVADTRTAAIAVTDTPPLYDTRYETRPIAVRSLIVAGTRHGDDPWMLRHIEVRGDRLNTDGTVMELMPGRRTYHSESGYGYALDNAPAWLHELAREALDGPAPAQPDREAAR